MSTTLTVVDKAALCPIGGFGVTLSLQLRKCLTVHGNRIQQHSISIVQIDPINVIQISYWISISLFYLDYLISYNYNWVTVGELIFNHEPTSKKMSQQLEVVYARRVVYRLERTFRTRESSSLRLRPTRALRWVYAMHGRCRLLSTLCVEWSASSAILLNIFCNLSFWQKAFTVLYQIKMFPFEEKVLFYVQAKNFIENLCQLQAEDWWPWRIQTDIHVICTCMTVWQ